VRACR